MNWILEAYSDVYTTAALRDVKAAPRILGASRASTTLARVVKFFGRG